MEDALEIASTLDSQGCFAGPEEPLEQYVTKQKKGIASQHILPQELVEAFGTKLKVDVTSLPVEETSKGLFPWELACCWIDEEGNSLIRVRPEGTGSPVHRTAVIAHELIHAMRGGLASTRFEEVTAYAATRALFPRYLSAWRCFLGPLFDTSYEVILFLVASWACWLIPFLLSLPLMPFLILPIGFLSWLTIRLIHRWRVWRSSFQKLERLCGHWALALIVRLSDDEIEGLATVPDEQVSMVFSERARVEWRLAIFEKKFGLST